MEILTITIQKGGTGKTTTAVVLTQASAYKGKKVLAIDLDPQANMSFALKADTNTENNAYKLITQGTAEPQTVDDIDIIPASWNLSALQSEKGSAKRLQKALEAYKNKYDIVIIDTPTQAGELQYNAIQAATSVLIPLQADIYNLQSLYQIAETMASFKKSNPNLIIKGFVINQIDNRSTISRELQEQIIITANKYNIPYLGSIRQGIAIKEAAGTQTSLYKYAPKSNPAIDFMKIWELIFADN